MAPENRQRHVHDEVPVGLGQRRAAGAGWAVFEAGDGAGELGFENRLVEEEGFLGAADEVEISADTGHGNAGVELMNRLPPFNERSGLVRTKLQNFLNEASGRN